MGKPKDPRKRVDKIASWLAEPMPRGELLAKVQADLACSRKAALRALARTRKVQKKRALGAADEGPEQVERLRLVAKEARQAGDYSSQIAAERLIADLVGTKAPERRQVAVELAPSQQALLDLAAAAAREEE